MPGLIDYVQKNFPTPEYQIFVIGINDSEGDQWTPMEPYWQKLSNGHAYRTPYNAQWGAKLYAEKGWDFRRILGHYYPGTELQTLY